MCEVCLRSRAQVIQFTFALLLAVPWTGVHLWLAFRCFFFLFTYCCSLFLLRIIINVRRSMQISLLAHKRIQCTEHSETILNYLFAKFMSFTCHLNESRLTAHACEKISFAYVRIYTLHLLLSFSLPSSSSMPCPPIVLCKCKNGLNLLFPIKFYSLIPVCQYTYRWWTMGAPEI